MFAFAVDRSVTGRMLSQAQFRGRASGSFASDLPPVQDAMVAKALSGLLGHGWLKIEPQVRSAVESAISGGGGDSAGKETLVDAWAAAQAVESFGGLLVDMLLEISDLCGDTGEVKFIVRTFALCEVSISYMASVSSTWGY
jgi:hypothetical protein